jgi:hypothetical protein
MSRDAHADDELRRIGRIADRLAERGLFDYAHTAAKEHHASINEMLGRSRLRSFVAARHRLLMLLHDSAGLSWPQIAEIFETRPDNIMVRSKTYKKVRAERESLTARRIAEYVGARGFPKLARDIRLGKWLTAPSSSFPATEPASGTRLARTTPQEPCLHRLDTHSGTGTCIKCGAMLGLGGWGTPRRKGRLIDSSSPR